jgi:uncharacterized phage-associated protein
MCERSDWTLTNLELQKMLYLAQMIYMGQHGGDRLLAGTFEAWDYGPVLPSVYREAKTYGSGPIRYISAGARIDDPERQKMLDEAHDQLSRASAGQLVSITHWKDGAWAKNYVPGARGVVIPDRDILEEYRRRAERNRD